MIKRYNSVPPAHQAAKMLSYNNYPIGPDNGGCFLVVPGNSPAILPKSENLSSRAILINWLKSYFSQKLVMLKVISSFEQAIKKIKIFIEFLNQSKRNSCYTSYKYNLSTEGIKMAQSIFNEIF